MSNEPVLPYYVKSCPFCGESGQVRATNIGASVICSYEQCTVRPCTAQFRSIAAATSYWNERKSLGGLFMPCDTCMNRDAKQPLCTGCLHNRSVIEGKETK